MKDNLSNTSWHRPTLLYGFKTFFVCIVACLLSFVSVTKIVRPVMQEAGIVALIHPDLLQTLINANLRGKSFAEIQQYLRTRNDDALAQAQIVQRNELFRPKTAQQYGLFLRNNERRKLAEGKAFITGKNPKIPPFLDTQPYSPEKIIDDEFDKSIPRNDAFHPTPKQNDHFTPSKPQITTRMLVRYVYSIASPDTLERNIAKRSSFLVVPIADTPFVAIARSDAAILPVIPTSSIILATALVCLILALAAFIIVAPVIFRIKRIEETCLAVSKGDYTARCNDNRFDSLGLLAKHVDEMTASIDQSFAQQKQLLQAVSHELRTPLSRIRFTIEMLNIDENDEKSMERLDSIDEDLTEIDNLLKELGYFNYVDAGNGRQHFEVNTLQDLVEATLRQRAIALEKFNVQIDGLDEKMTIEADPTAFKRVLGNLLSNAARYATNWIQIHIQLQDDTLQISVEDDGPGIPENKRNVVFDPFVCLDKSRSKSFGGVGLGLAIVHRIMKVHRGSIHIETGKTGGALMVTRWPVRQTHD